MNTNSLSITPTPDLPSSQTGDRFGEVLARIVSLNRHDVYEILAEQAGSRKKFGQIALAWSLCEPTHVWQAWTQQLVGRTPRVNLAQFGIDSQATAELPGWVASALNVVPVRLTEDRLIVATTASALPRATELLASHSRKPITFVLAGADEIRQAVERYYMNMPENAGNGCASKRCGMKCNGGGCISRRRNAAAMAGPHLEGIVPERLAI